MPAVLIVETGKHKSKRLKLPDGRNVVGRDEEAQIRIASNDVSRMHCVLICENGRITVEDLESRNGTFVNGAPLRGATALQPGDLLVIGPMAFRVPLPEANAPAGTPPVLPTLKPQASNSGLSDDDIAAFLASSMGEPVSDADTAVIEIGTPPAKAAPPIEPSPPVAAPPKKRAFRSTAEEAADIIRRHKESLARGESSHR